MQICNNVMTVAIPKNKFFIMISLAEIVFRSVEQPKTTRNTQA